MSTTQYIREQLGLTQEALAIYLSISMSQLAMHETGKRDLPSNATVKIAELLTLLKQSEKNTKAKKERMKQEWLVVTKQLRTKIIDLEFQLAKEKRKLEAIEKKLEQNSKLKAITNLLSENKNQPNPLLYLNSKSRMDKISIAVQTQQIVKIEGIQSQLECAKKLLDTKR